MRENIRTNAAGYYATYRNLGRFKRTAIFKTRKEAEGCRDFLKFQGAAEVRLKRIKKDEEIFINLI